MTIDAKGTDLQDFLRLIAEVAKLNLICDQDVQGIYTFKFVETPWDQVLDMILKHAGLGKEVNNGVIRVAKVEKLQKEEEDRKRLEDAKALSGETQNISRPLSFAKVSEVKPILDRIITKRGSIITDERTNTLIISDLPRNIVLIDDLIAQLDVQIQQVQIEARVVEASKGFEQDWGVKWPTSGSGDAKLQVAGADAVWGTYGTAPSWNSAGGFNRPTSGQSIGAAWSGGKPGVTDIAGAAGEFWVSFLSNRMSVNVILQALEKEGKVKIVSTPKVVTQNNKKAKILSGEKIPYPTQQGGAAGGAITVAFVEANLELDVTPQITNDGTIIMDIKVEKSEADFSRTVQGSPTILRKEIDTQVLVKDGGTAVLGGVYTTNTTNGMTGVPFISRIPVLGWLFKTKSEKENTAELLIFITPRILKS
ncbi:MAG: type IV pilus secretin PilQ [Holophaga sp.]